MTAKPKTTTLRYRVLHMLDEEGPGPCHALVPEGSDYFKTRACLIGARDVGLVISIARGQDGTFWALTPLGVSYLDAMEEGRAWSVTG